MLLWYLTES
jgi:hypothetical protein